MKTYKLWIEIEEHDRTTGKYRNVTTIGEASPVPVAEFATLEDAVRLAELFAMDTDPAELPVHSRSADYSAVN